MCGIAGFVGHGERADVERMAKTLEHRGPDDKGIVFEHGVALGFARLAIIDITASGHQPMWSEDKKKAIVFNGEIYNFKTLRKELEQKGHTFRSSSDTEVILKLYDEYGEGCFEKMVGMFGIALYDLAENKLLLARDRMGEKPLYWAKTGKTLLFASEVKSLLASGLVEKVLNTDALNQYLLFDYVPTPHSIFSGIQKLEPATVLVYQDGAITKKSYWKPSERLSDISIDEAKSKLDSLLAQSVSRQLVADVPLGVFLSGGLDSSTVSYYAQKASSRPIETFSIGFDEGSFDESGYARQMAKALGTNHHEKIVTPQDALDLVPKLGDVLDEPMADASILPTLLLSKFTREHVTVALGGDGGDELFAGYPTFLAERYFSVYARLPGFMRELTERTVRMWPASHKNMGLAFLAGKFVSGDASDQVRRHMEWLGTFGESDRHALVQGKYDVFSEAEAYSKEYLRQDEGNKLLWTYARTYLMDQVLVKIDRASMHFSLETRAPFLDHEIVDFAFSLPYSFKRRGNVLKYLLKETMRGKLPQNIIDRPKKGFGVPMAKWLHGPLKELCTDLLSSERLRKQGIFDPKPVERLLEEHMSLSRDNRKELWNLMVFQLWYDRWMA
jgi:asparagine synthase (glutamine-hydrolysing)